MLLSKPDADDFAVLRLKGKLLADAKPVVLDQVDGSSKHPFQSLGYPLVGDYSKVEGWKKRESSL